MYIDTDLVLSMYNMHPYFSFKNVGKNAHYTCQNKVFCDCMCSLYNPCS